MDSQSMPANVGSNDELGPAPTQAEIDRLMKRCQVGVGGRRALDDAHDIMAECYGTLGRQQMEIDRLRDVLQACQRHLACNAYTEDLQALYQRVREEDERA